MSDDIERLKGLTHEGYRYCAHCGVFLMPSEGELCDPCERGEERDE